MFNARRFYSTGTALAVACLLVSASAARAGDEEIGLRSTQHPEGPQQGNIMIESKHPADAAAESPDWSALNWDVSRLPVPAPKNKSWRSSAPAIIQPEWNRKNNDDGSSAVTVKRSLPTTLESKVGIDMTLAARSGGDVQPIDPDKLAPGYTPDQSSGAAWASVTAPVPLGWDKASFNARFDPLHEERKFGTELSKSVPLGERFSVTLQNGYSVTQPGAVTASALPNPAIGAIQPQHGPSEFYTSENSARLNVLSTGTAFSIGSTMSTVDDRWLNSLKAEQKLFDGVSITGAVSETASGEPNKSLTAGFKRNW